MSMDHRTEMLLDEFFSGEVTPELIESIEAWLREDPKNPELLLELGLIDRLLGREQRKLDASAVFALMREAEEAAGPIIVDLTGSLKPDETVQQDPVSFRQACSIAGYLAWQKLATPRVIGIVSAAAVLLLSTVLIIAFSHESREPQTAQTPRVIQAEPQPTQEPDPTTVATLTDAIDARWAHGSYDVGDELAAGTNMILASGTAEITTGTGARVLLQAPCSIELTDSDNAIRLISGKLVGVCETESARGLVVRTPHMVITDLGTRFGVDASSREQTQTHVFVGEVQVSPVAAGAGGAEPVHVVTGQAVACGEDSQVTEVAFDQVAFEDILAPTLFMPEFVSGRLTWGGAAPAALYDQQQESQSVQVFLEQSDLLLQDPVAVDGVAGVQWFADENPAGYELAAGQRVDTYILHADPREGRRIEGEFVVRFDRPIMGVIGRHKTFIDSNGALGAPWTTYRIEADANNPGPNQGIENDGREVGDYATISPDGRTLSFAFYASTQTDQIRVIVQAKQATDD